MMLTALARPFPWEAAYPPGVAFDMPIAIGDIPTLIGTAIAAHAPRPAIEFRGVEISYAALGKGIDAAACGLAALGVASDTPVGLYLPNTPAHPFAFFGVLRAGGRVVHLSPLDAERVLAHKLRDSGAKLIVTTNLSGQLPMALRLLAAGLIDNVAVIDDARFGPGAEAPLPLPDDPRVAFLDLSAGKAVPAAWPKRDPDQIALLQYTGGTTGLPKGAMLSHGNLTAAVSMYNNWLEGSGLSNPPNDRVICVLPLFHIFALTTILIRHLSRGNLVMLRQRFDVDTLLHDIEKKRATSFPGVPTMWIALSNVAGLETRDFSSLHHCSSGGAPLPIEIERRFEALTGQRLGGGWGMTETSPAGTNQPRTGPAKHGSIGIPLPGIELDVVANDEPDRVLPPGEIGELRIKGPNVFGGYWNQPEATARVFVDGRFLTGDIGFMDEDGHFTIVERKNDLIISSGFNVYPQMIEQAIYEHPSVAEVIVIGVPDEYRGEAAKAFVTLRSGAEPFTLEALRAFLDGRVGRHEMPAGLEFRAVLPKTAVGKLSRQLLREDIEAAKTAGEKAS